MKICIDAGHNYSGADTGAVGNRLKEQDITFYIADKLKTLFISNGIQVVMTRNKLTDNIGTSVNSSINTRVAICNSNKCDYAISIHCNAGGGIGTEVYVYKKGGKAERIAKKVVDKISRNIGLTNRGVKEGNFGFVRNTNCPAVLVETAFIDNAKDAALLKTNQDGFARAVFEGFMDFAGLSIISANEEIKKFLTDKWSLTQPEDVFWLIEQHPYKDTLYKKIYDSYSKVYEWKNTSSVEDIKTFLSCVWSLSDPLGVFVLLDSHGYKEDLYRKIYQSYKK